MRAITKLLLFPFVMTAVVWAGEPVLYEVSGEKFEGYAEKGRDGSPLILLVHDWDGLTEYEVKRAGMLADIGYSVFCADLFGVGIRPTEIADRRKCTTMLSEDRPKMRALMQGALDAAKAQGLNVGNCVAMGYCFGGTAVLEFARSGAELKGWATFHGGLGLPDGQDYSKVSGEFLVMHSIQDGMAPFSGLAEGLETAGVGAQLICYSDAPHGWTVFGSDRYREDADKQSWLLFLQFLNDVLKK
ncbi:MAG: dienelactone hydrolase family protein [Pontiellaceae bacterium]|nr:dienelactone hydrolase family protein [Pontiellaceae bacterium]MBN2783885.1 dienelactone hydrolase family protein [Pontiellaceae bacterium]